MRPSSVLHIVVGPFRDRPCPAAVAASPSPTATAAKVQRHRLIARVAERQVILIQLLHQFLAVQLAARPVLDLGSPQLLAISLRSLRPYLKIQVLSLFKFNYKLHLSRIIFKFYFYLKNIQNIKQKLDKTIIIDD